jgi:hypothetical protein
LSVPRVGDPTTAHPIRVVWFVVSPKDPFGQMNPPHVYKR